MTLMTLMMSTLATLFFPQGHSQYLAFSSTFSGLGEKRHYSFLSWFSMHIFFLLGPCLNARNWSLRLIEKSLIHYLYIAYMYGQIGHVATCLTEASMFSDTYIHTYIHTHIHTYIYIYIYVHTYTFICLYIRSYTRVHVFQRKEKEIRNKYNNVFLF